MTELRTARLVLRRWRPQDEPPMTAINRDPEVQRYLNRPVGEAALAAFLPSVREHWERHGFGLYAVESREPAERRQLLGFAGVAYPTFLPQLAERPEIGWRLARRAWGRGLATEAALAVRAHAFGTLALPELISIVHPENARSQRVATKLGMTVERQVWHAQLRRFVDVWALPAAPAG
ncbi:MAG TPA: GNAT family N-acetyltransferase [Conexibacter sp.]|nr:GNAT family N-acetyltransferase [Conexibacter sp.]